MNLVADTSAILASALPSTWCRAFFGSFMVGWLSLYVLSTQARTGLLAYGARTQQQRARAGQVPHAWFAHFYAASLVFSAAWAFQFIQGRGPLFSIMTWQVRGSAGESTTGGVDAASVAIAWAAMVVQGARRLWECLRVTRSAPGSTMLVLQWLLGTGFYFFVNVAIWIDGSNDLLQATALDMLSIPSLKTTLALILFGAASIQQYRCHKYLASLPKYTLPEWGWFKALVCPHYTCECLIYVALAGIAAPRGQFANTTLLYVLAFVVANLAVTANSTKQFYCQKFGQEKLIGRWRMIPYLY